MHVQACPACSGPSSPLFPSVYPPHLPSSGQYHRHLSINQWRRLTTKKHAALRCASQLPPHPFPPRSAFIPTPPPLQLIPHPPFPLLSINQPISFLLPHGFDITPFTSLSPYYRRDGIQTWWFRHQRDACSLCLYGVPAPQAKGMHNKPLFLAGGDVELRPPVWHPNPALC